MYTCNGCGKSIGLMADMKGDPTLYFCPRNHTVEGPQIVVERRVFPKQKRRKKSKNYLVEREAE